VGKTYRLLLVAIICCFPICGVAQDSQTQQTQAPQSQAQQPQAASATNTTGPTAFIQVGGTRTPIGSVYNGAIGVGYNITGHFGGDIGIPLYAIQSPYSIVTNHDWRWTTLMGDPFIDLRYTTKHLGMDMTSVLTGTMPFSSAERVFSTGRFGVDWFNHVETHFIGLTPFLNFGAASGTVDRYVLPRPYDIARPYQTLGFISNFEGGASFKLLKYYSVGASGYALVPAGPQKVFSRLVSPDSGVAGDANHYRYWNNAFETIGNSTIDRDNGYSGWVQVARVKNLKVQVGYTYSIHYALGSAFVFLRFDGTSLIRFLTATQ
jgi:hypothetical protein